MTWIHLHSLLPYLSYVDSLRKGWKEDGSINNLPGSIARDLFAQVMMRGVSSSETHIFRHR